MYLVSHQILDSLFSFLICIERTTADTAECFVQCHAITVGLLSAAYYQANEQQLTVWCQNDVSILTLCLVRLGAGNKGGERAINRKIGYGTYPILTVTAIRRIPPIMSPHSM